MKKNYLFIILLAMILIISCTPSQEYLLKKRSVMSNSKRYVRILIKKTNKQVSISSKSRLRVTEIECRGIKYDGKGIKINFLPENIKKAILIESWGKPLCLDGKYYRGMIEFHNVLGKIYIINIVSIAEYLYGVVPSEMLSSWDIEAIKAQAVAARTYTYYHIMNNKNSLYDLDTSTNFQSYNGMLVEGENTKRAVDETSGEIVVHQNIPILALFHSTCGMIISLILFFL